MKISPAPVILTITLALASCGGSESDTVDLAAGVDAAPTTVVDAFAVASTTVPPVSAAGPLVVIAETGGCFMMGPNCSTTVVMSDGSFRVFRTDPADVLAVPADSTQAELSGQLDVQDLAEAIADTDFDALTTQLGAGTCNGCVDGIDLYVRFYTDSGAVDLDSQQYGFDSAVEVFRSLELVQMGIGESGDLEIMQRGG